MLASLDWEYAYMNKFGSVLDWNWYITRRMTLHVHDITVVDQIWTVSTVKVIESR